MRNSAEQLPSSSLLRLSSIDQSFVPGRPVLKSVDFDVAVGEIHALLGENGAGKSTLMNVLVGLVAPDRGALEVAGEARSFAHWHPADAQRAGVAMVHQHSTLVPAMTVEENFWFADGRRGFRFDRRAAGRLIAELAERHGLEVPRDTQVAAMSVGQRQRAEILRALDRGARLLILDEPTAALTPSETDELFPALEALRSAGQSVVFISHKLDEVERLADRVTVLRRGACVGTVPARDRDAAALGRMMLGREMPALERPMQSPPEADVPLLSLVGVSAPGVRDGSRLRAIDLDVNPAEVVGVAGIDGNGQLELEELLAGLRPMTEGRLSVDGTSCEPGVLALRARGVAQLSGDREGAGLVAGLTLVENWILKASGAASPYFRRGVFVPGPARSATLKAIEEFDIHPPDPAADVATLSGGNAQKLAVARELADGPSVFIAVNPTRGLDVGSARVVHERLLAVRQRGGAVLLISTELDEVIALSDRLFVLVRGQLVAAPPGASRAAIGAIMLGREGTL